jgi:hypothetical protein
VVVWGSTRWTQFGYSHNTNLHFHMKDKWDESKFDPNDPRNSLVDPNVVVAAYKDKLAKGKGVSENVFCLAS